MRRTLALLVVVGFVGCGPQPQPEPPPRPVVGPPGATDPVARPAPDPAPAPGPDPAPAPAPAPAAGGDPDPDHPIVALHNAERAKHCAPPLAWSDKLAKVAQKWADHLRDTGCAFGHSNTMYGENLAAGTSSVLDDAEVVGMWYREVDDYDWKHPDFSGTTGHFTQLVWLGTTRVGCGRSACKGNDIVVCNYDPAGNVMTEFAANVLPASCKNRKSR